VSVLVASDQVNDTVRLLHDTFIPAALGSAISRRMTQE